MFCGKCGKQMADDAAFCGECGAPNIDIAKNQTANQAQQNTYRPPVYQKSQPSFDFSKITNKFKENPWIIRLGIAVVVLVIAFFVSKSIYNYMHNPTKTILSLSTALKNQDAATVTKIVKTKSGQPLNPAAAKVFTTYYNKNFDFLRSKLTSLDDPSLGDKGVSKAVQSAFSSNSGYAWDAKNILGFKTYSLVIPTDQLKIRAPKGAAIKLEDNADIQATGDFQSVGDFVLGVPVHVLGTLKTDWGDITETKDIQVGQNNELTFPDALYYNIDTSKFPKGAPIQINGKDSGKLTGDSSKIGPLPKNTNYTFSVVAKFPFGDLAFTGSSTNMTPNSYSPAQLQLDPSSGKNLLQAIADVIDKFGTADVTTGADPNAYVMANSPKGMRYRPTYSIFPTTKYIFLKMQLFGNSLAVSQTYDGQTIVDVQVLESYKADNNTYDNTWIYSMIWDDAGKRWLIYDNQSSYSKGTPSSADIINDHTA